MSTCPKCGGDMIGDGVHDHRHCENVVDHDWSIEPDAAPQYCDFDESEPSKPTMISPWIPKLERLTWAFVIATTILMLRSEESFALALVETLTITVALFNLTRTRKQ